MRTIHLFDPPDRFVTGTVGMPGERTFYLQARAGARVTSVALEKTQVALLAEQLDGLISDLDFTQQTTGDDLPLDVPVIEEFRVGVLAWGLDATRNAVLIEAQAIGEEDLIDAESDDGPDLLRVFLTFEQARGFVERTRAVVAAGRPDCPFCTLPIDPGGHLCPRANGYRR